MADSLRIVARPSLVDYLSAIGAKRALAGSLPRESTPYVTAESFKTGVTEKTAYAKSWDEHFSQEAARRIKSTLKAASALSKPNELISLGTARPAPRYYPWQSISMHVSSPDGSCDSMVGMCCEKDEIAYDLGVALNYGYAAGSPQLLRFITEHVEMVHDPPYKDWDVSLTCSTTSAIDVVFRMLCNPRDSILVEEFTYSGTAEAAKGLGLRMVSIHMDEEGLSWTNLESVLRNWNLADGPRPTTLYTIPTGQNPTGVTQSENRRRAIYDIADQYDLLIIEDDPYYLVQLRNLECLRSTTNGRQVDSCAESSIESSQCFVSSLPPSYLSLDISGRVLRMETTSKILSPGLRCGWLTGCSQLVQKFVSYTELSTVAPSGVSQVLLYKLLDECWGHAGFFTWLDQLSSQYRRRLQTLLVACEKYLPARLCSWTIPSAGMFLWLRVDWTRHPIAATISAEKRHGSVLEVEDLLYKSALQCGVLVSKGSWFSTDIQCYSQIHLRLTFAAACDQELEEAVKRLGVAFCKEFRVT